MARCNVCRDKKLTDEQLLVLKNLNTNLADQWSDTTDKPTTANRQPDITKLIILWVCYSQIQLTHFHPCIEPN